MAIIAKNAKVKSAARANYKSEKEYNEHRKIFWVYEDLKALAEKNIKKDFKNGCKWPEWYITFKNALKWSQEVPGTKGHQMTLPEFYRYVEIYSELGHGIYDRIAD